MRAIILIFAFISSFRVYAQSNMQVVDLGLPSGTLWADRNVGASNQYSYGNNYNWGNTQNRIITKYGTSACTKYNKTGFDGDNKTELESIDDKATLVCGTKFVTPSVNDFEELISFCKKENVKIKGIRCLKLIGPNGNYIVFPSDSVSNKMYHKYIGHYWTRNLYEEFNIHAYEFEFYDTELKIGNYERTNLFSIRPVIKKTINTEIQKPQLFWLGATSVTTQSYSLQIGVKSNSRITSSDVYLNGQKSRGVVSVENNGFDHVIKLSLTLTDGSNDIRVDVANASGTSTLTQNVVYNPKKVNPVPNPQPIPTPNINVGTQKRIALVIGNGKYTHATTLLNPNNDATDISAKLRSLGFEVIEKHDLGKRAFKDVIREFGSKVQIFDAAVLYYAGHAIENNGKNYLIPVDADMKVQADVEDECIRADYIIESLENAKCKMNIIVLDACRNNPIPRSWSRGNSIGLSSMTAPTGTFIAFSTAPGHTADDGTGRNSPFTEAFLKNLDIPNTQLEVFFKKVLQDVSKKTSNRQIPWTQSSFIGDFYFNISK